MKYSRVDKLDGTRVPLLRKILSSDWLNTDLTLDDVWLVEINIKLVANRRLRKRWRIKSGPTLCSFYHDSLRLNYWKF